MGLEQIKWTWTTIKSLVLKIDGLRLKEMSLDKINK